MVNEKEKRKPEVGDIMNYTKEVDIFVVDENGNQIPCENVAQAKILSLLLELNKVKKEEIKKE